MTELAEFVPFQIRKLDPHVLEGLRVEADKQQSSISEVMRQILCSLFGMNCPRSFASSRFEGGSVNFILWMPPELHAAIKLRSRTEGVSMQQVVRAALGA